MPVFFLMMFINKKYAQEKPDDGHSLAVLLLFLLYKGADPGPGTVLPAGTYENAIIYSKWHILPKHCC